MRDADSSASDVARKGRHSLEDPVADPAVERVSSSISAASDLSLRPRPHADTVPTPDKVASRHPKKRGRHLMAADPSIVYRHSVTNWQRFSDRLAGKPVDDTLHEGVPAHLDRPLRRWLGAFLSRSGSMVATRVTVRLQMSPDMNETDWLVHSTSPVELLDAVDAAIQLHPGWEVGQSRLEQLLDDVGSLHNLLQDGGSAYKIDMQIPGLGTRVDQTVTAAADQAAEAALQADRRSAADHLRQAWRAAYGLHPDATKGYSEAVKAVEAAAIPVVLPRDDYATLGKVLKHLHQASDKWQLAIPGPDSTGDIGPLVEMLRLLWTGQSDRHGGTDPTKHVDQKSAEMAVHLATTLVQWFAAGHVSCR